jgi:hypothetical protein
MVLARWGWRCVQTGATLSPLGIVLLDLTEQPPPYATSWDATGVWSSAIVSQPSLLDLKCVAHSPRMVMHCDLHLIVKNLDH